MRETERGFILTRQARLKQEHIHGAMVHTDTGFVFRTRGPTLPRYEVWLPGKTLADVASHKP